MEKRCSKCGEWKPLSEFRKHVGNPDGLDYHCKDCKTAIDAAYRGANLEDVLARREKYRNIDVQLIYDRYERGDISKEIAKDLGVSVSYVVDKLKEKYGTSKNTTPFQRKVRELFEAGMCSVEIAAETGKDVNRVGHAMKALGLKFSDEQRERSKQLGKAKLPGPDEQSIIQRIEAIGQYEYLGGYTNSEGTVKLKCKVCGLTFEKPCVSIRHGNIQCQGCAEAERQKREEERRLESVRKKQERQERKAAKEREKERERERKRVTKICVECGLPFETMKSNVVCCSPDCQKRRTSRIHSLRRQKSKTSIPLKALYIRDGGTCYICGKQCSFDDHTTVNGHFVVGKSYPTVEHVIPICAGGADSWDNVKLACHACNSAKGRKSLVKMERSGQIALII